MSILQDLKDKVMGTEEQNEKAKKEMAEQDAKNPDTTQAKVNRMIEKVKPTKEPVKKAKGGMISSASKRADGCAVKGKTRGRIV
jgi:predicted lipase